MPDCCSPKGYRWVFSERAARGEAKRYRRKGLDATSARIVAFLKSQGVEGRTVLEVGGGIGAIQIELLKAGAARATSVELTPTYEEVAGELLNEAGLADRVERKVMDFAEAASQVDGADIVILNRVICCYPDMPYWVVSHLHYVLFGGAVMGVFAGIYYWLPLMSGKMYNRKLAVWHFWWTVIGLGLANLMLLAARREFHIFLHPPRRIIATSERHGLRPLLNQNGVLWIVSALRRAV